MSTKTCWSCGTHFESAYTGTVHCGACRQVQAIKESSTSSTASAGSSDPFSETLLSLVQIGIGIVAVYWMWKPMWLVIKFFGSIFFGIGD